MSRPLLVSIISISLLLLAGCQTSGDSQQANPQEPAGAEAAAEQENPAEESEEILAHDEGPQKTQEGETIAPIDPACEELDEERFVELEFETDLNGNGLKDRAMVDKTTCYPRSCSAAILEACPNGGYKMVAQVGYFQILEARDETTEGWRDLNVQKAGRDEEGLIESSFETYVWDGETYVGDH